MSATTATRLTSGPQVEFANSALGATVRLEHVTKTYGETTAMNEVCLNIPSGSSLALVGPSGSGKTTVLRSIAGLVTPDLGNIWIGEDHVTSDNHSAPAERRHIGMVFQDWALFPHLSIAGNVGYGIQRDPNKVERIKNVLELVQLSGFEDRKIHEISGGQAQRVALARALATEPRVMLFDEAFSSLDANLRHDVCAHTAQLMHDLGITAIYVTHDRREANTLGDRVAVLRAGTVEQCDTPSQVYNQPLSPWVAEFTGDANLIPATAQGDTAHTCLGSVPLAEVREGACEVLIRPEQLALTSNDSTSSDEPGAGMVTEVTFGGHETTYEIIVLNVSVTVRELGFPRLSVGNTVSVTYTADSAVSYPVTTPAE